MVITYDQAGVGYDADNITYDGVELVISPPLAGLFGGFPKFDVTLGPLYGSTETVSVPLEDLEFTAAVNGGFAELRGLIREQDRLSNPSYFKGWTPIRVTVASDENWEMRPGTVLWDGLLRSDAMPTPEGKASIVAVGAKMFAEEANGPLLFRYDPAPSDWVARDGDPHLFDSKNSSKYEVKNDTVLKFTRKKEDFNKKDDYGLCLWRPGFRLRKLAFRSTRNWNTPNIVIRVFKFVGARGSPIGTVTEVGTPVSFKTGALPASVDSTFTVTDPTDALRIDIDCIRAHPKPNAAKHVVLTNVKVYDIADDDLWVAGGTTKSVSYEVAVNRLGYHSDITLNPVTTNLVLPIMWNREQPWSELFDALATYEGRYWRVDERNGSAWNSPWKFTFADWDAAPSETWTAELSYISGRPEPADDVYNRVQVFYEGIDRQPKTVILDADGLEGRPVDPFANTVRQIPAKKLDTLGAQVPGDPDATHQPKVFTYTLSDPQPDDVLAKAVGKAILEDYNQTQYQGQIQLLHANDPTGQLKPACLIKPGYRITIKNWLPGVDKTFRVYGVQVNQVLTTLEIGRKPTETDRILAGAQKMAERYDRWKVT